LAVYPPSLLQVFNDSHRPDLVRASVEKTIKDLGVGYLDMLLIVSERAGGSVQVVASS